MSRKPEIELCDQKIEAAGDFIDAKKYNIAVETLKAIQCENVNLIETSPFLKMGLHSYLGLAYYHFYKTEGSETDTFLLSAVKHFDKALGVKEASENILFMRAKCHDYLDNIEAAKSDYERVIELNPKADCAHAFLGLLMENEGYHLKAIELYKIALDLDPTYDAVSERLKNLLGNMETPNF